MAGTFEGIEKYLKEKKLTSPDLEILKPDANLYKTLAYQPKGRAVAENNEGKIFIGNSKNDKDTSGKFEAFFELAIKKKVHLALTPEYSCPWDVLENIITKGKAPANNALWIIGCESILPSELKEFISETESDEISIICEEELLEKDDSGFFDPICYMFKAKTGDEVEKLVLVIQFKAHPMGDLFEFELDNLIRGQRRYIIRNSLSSIYLITLICSGCFDFNKDQDELIFNDKPYIIFHPQLNLAPRNTQFKKYRSEIYFDQKISKKDTICLNWAKGTSILDNEIALSCSSVYIKSESTTNKIDIDRILANDKLGLYYQFWESRTGLFSFDSYEAIYLFENFKSSQTEAPPQVDGARRGPKMLSTFKWEKTKWEAKTEIKNDDLDKYIRDEFGKSIDEYFPKNVSLINRERLLALSTGEIVDKNWTHPTKNELFKVKGDEFYSRIALFQDPETKLKKRNLLTKYDTLLNSYLGNPEIFPSDSQLIDLKKGCSISYSDESLNTNVKSHDDIPACVVYAGDIDKARANELKDIIITNLNKDQIQKRVLILHNHRGELNPVYGTTPTISESTARSEVSYKKRRD